MEVFRLFGSVFLKDKEAQQGLDGVDSKAQGVGGRLSGMIGTAAKWGAGLATAAAAAGTAVFALTNRVTANAEAIGDNAAKMGVSTDAYQEMAYWADQNNVSADAMDRAMGRLNQRVGRAADGNEKYAGALESLGINMDDVRDGTLSTEDAMKQSIQSLSEMENAQDQSALASELFGTKLARDLMPALQDGSMSFEEAAERAEELGIILSEDQIEAANEFQQSWSDVKQTLGGIVTQIGLSVLPVFQSMLDWVLQYLPNIREVFSTAFEAIGSATSWITDGIANVISFIQDWASQSEGSLSEIWAGFQVYLGLLLEYWSTVFGSIQEVIQEVFSFIVPFVMEILTSLAEFWQENGQALLETAITIFQSVQETVMTALQAVWTIIQEVLGLVIPFVQEQLAVLQQFWQENGEMIMQAVQNAFSFIQSIIEFVMPAVLAIIEMVWGLISGLFNGALNFIMGLIQTFSGLFTGNWSEMWEGIKQMVMGALEFVWNFIQLTLVGRVIGAIRSFATMGMNLFRQFGTNITSTVSNLINGVLNFFRNLGTSAGSIISSMVSRVLGFISNMRATAQSTVSNMVSGVLGFFRNMGSGIANTVSNIFSRIRNTFNDILSFITGLGSSFLNAGKGLIDQMVKGITGAVGKVKDAVSGVADTVRNFLPFSPAKEGPLSDLDKLDFEGPIGDSIERGKPNIASDMEEVLALPDSDIDVYSKRNQHVSNEQQGRSERSANNRLEELLILVIQAIKENKDFIIDGKAFARLVGDYSDSEGGRRVRRERRGLA